MKRRTLRVLALMHDTLVPPEDVSGADLRNVPWKTEFDVVSTMQELGHEVHSLGVSTDLLPIRNAIDSLRPHVVFNLLEDFHDVPIYDQNVVSYLELLRVPYTGCNPRGLTLARDKAISKKLLAYHRIRVPEFTVVRLGRRPRRTSRLPFPLIVKSLVAEGSAGITQASIVYDDEKLAERVAWVHEHLATDAIVERYIEGRELYVGVLGNHRLQVLPVWELHFTKLSDDAPRIATEKVKWDAAYQKKVGIRTGLARGFDDTAIAGIQRLCKRIYRVLQMSGYARIDLRLTQDGTPYVLEANPNPQLAYGEDFAESADRAGIGYDELIQRILLLGIQARGRPVTA